ncbi:hypothetical protein AGMMS50239_39720 [Bacteroidia bacterium]|nr:hypothetical protein AGMMS50239_39720 [Bacteroidia bacterium]
MKHINYLFGILIFVFLLCTVSCNDDENAYKSELYKKVFALVSADNYNVFTAVHDLEEPESTGYVSVSCGGTTPTDKDILINLKLDNDLFDRYNKGNYDVEENKYANILPADKYTIDNYSITVPAGERSGRMKIRMRPEGLSPDSIYFISLKIDNYSVYEANPTKSDILYRVLLKNSYALQSSSSFATSYSMRGMLGVSNVMGTKSVFPLTHNSVRVMAGNETFQADTALINGRSIILEVDDRNHVTVKPFKHLYVEQIDGDPDYPNIYFIDDDGFRKFKTFQLRYNYRKAGDATLYEMKEELRVELKK